MYSSSSILFYLRFSCVHALTHCSSRIYMTLGKVKGQTHITEYSERQRTINLTRFSSNQNQCDKIPDETRRSITRGYWVGSWNNQRCLLDHPGCTSMRIVSRRYANSAQTCWDRIARCVDFTSCWFIPRPMCSYQDLTNLENLQTQLSSNNRVILCMVLHAPCEKIRTASIRRYRFDGHKSWVSFVDAEFMSRIRLKPCWRINWNTLE